MVTLTPEVTASRYKQGRIDECSSEVAIQSMHINNADEVIVSTFTAYACRLPRKTLKILKISAGSRGQWIRMVRLLKEGIKSCKRRPQTAGTHEVHPPMQRHWPQHLEQASRSDLNEANQKQRREGANEGMQRVMRAYTDIRIYAAGMHGGAKGLRLFSSLGAAARTHRRGTHLNAYPWKHIRSQQRKHEKRKNRRIEHTWRVGNLRLSLAGGLGGRPACCVLSMRCVQALFLCRLPKKGDLQTQLC